jgi:ATP-dependent helicase/nuclease subunit A
VSAVDRTFIDENGCRWLIDYRISPHAGGDLAGFLDAQAARYRERLERYAAFMADLDPRSLRLGLYFSTASCVERGGTGDAYS